jgi:hypothetical protein
MADQIRAASEMAFRATRIMAGVTDVKQTDDIIQNGISPCRHDPVGQGR